MSLKALTSEGSGFMFYNQFIMYELKQNESNLAFREKKIYIYKKLIKLIFPEKQFRKLNLALTMCGF